MTPNDYYNFVSLPLAFTHEQCDAVGSRLRERFARFTRSWSVRSNSEWATRIYYSAKMILSATVSVNSLRYAEHHNLRVVVPYLSYYSVLSLVRAIAYTIPEESADLDRLFHMSHASAINKAIAHISSFDRKFGDRAKDTMRLLKAQRELISYRAPTSGDQTGTNTEDVIQFCRLLAEIAQFNSEFLDESVLKYSSPATWDILDEHATKIATVEIEGFTFQDMEDAYRLDWLRRKSPRATNILFSMTEGHTEDFFFAWKSDDDEYYPENFDPDLNTQIIFDVP